MLQPFLSAAGRGSRIICCSVFRLGWRSSALRRRRQRQDFAQLEAPTVSAEPAKSLVARHINSRIESPVAGSSWSSTSSSTAGASRRRPSRASCRSASTSAAAPPRPARTHSHTATRSRSFVLSRAAIIEDKQWNNCEGKHGREQQK
jgi:hypothetical protein